MIGKEKNLSNIPKVGIFTKKQLEIGNRRMKIIFDIIQKNGLNWNKFLCLKAGNCHKKSHKAGVYKNEMECEAALVAAIELHVQLSGISAANFKLLITKLNESTGRIQN